MVPVIKVMEQFIQTVPFIKPFLFRQHLEISIVKLIRETSKHRSNTKIKLRMTVKRSGVEDYWFFADLPNITAPQVTMKQRGFNLNN